MIQRRPCCIVISQKLLNVNLKLGSNCITGESAAASATKSFVNSGNAVNQKLSMN